MNKTTDVNNQAQIDNFFNNKIKKNLHQKKQYSPNKTNLFKEALASISENSSYLAKRIIMKTISSDNFSPTMQEYTISLPWNKNLILPANINQPPYIDYIINLQNQIKTIEYLPIFSNEIAINLQYFFDIIQYKINFYNNSSNSHNSSIDILILIFNSISFIDQLSDSLKPDSNLNINNVIHFINFNTILIYACPEIADKDILTCFLQIKNNYQKFKIEAIYQHLKSHIFNNIEIFNASLHSKYHFESRYTFGLPKLAAFFLAINYDIKTDKHSVEKIIRRYDEFQQKISDFFLQANKVMHDKNIVFTDLSEIDKENIIICSSESAKILAEHGLLLEKANFSHLLSSFDSIIGGFFNSLDAVVDSKYKNLTIDRITEKRHLLLIATDLIDSLYNIPEMLIELINENSHIIDDKKTSVYNIMQGLRAKIAQKIIFYLDQCLIELDHNFICNKLISIPQNNTEKKARDWRNIATNSLRNLDNNINKTDSFMTNFNQKLEFRKVILKGFSDIICTLNKELGDNNHFLYDYCISSLIHQVGNELKKQQNSKNNVLTAEILTIVFNKAYHSIDQHIDDAQDKFARSLLESCRQYSISFAAKRPNKNDTFRKEKKQSQNVNINLIERGEYNTVERLTKNNKNYDKPILEQIEETKQLFSIMLCTYYDSYELENTHLSLVENLIGNKPKNSQITNTYTTNINELSIIEISEKINGKKLFSLVNNSLNFITDKSLRPAVSREKTTLVVAENIRRKNYIIMEKKDHQNLKHLCQYTLQATKLKMKKLSLDKESYKKLSNYLDNKIKNVDKITETRIINPVKWLIDSLNTVYSLTTNMMQLQDNLQMHFDNLFNDYNNFLKTVYNKKITKSWNIYLQEYFNAIEDNTFIRIINGSNLNQEQKYFIVNLFKIYDECIIDVFQSKLAKKLPPSLETVTIYNKIMAFHLGSDIIKNNSQSIPNNEAICNTFKTSIIYYNDHLKSLAEQIAFNLYRKPDHHAEKIKQLDQTFKKVIQIIQDKAITQMMCDFEDLHSHEASKEMLAELNRKLDKLFELNFFQKYFGKQSRVFNYLEKIVGFCSKNKAFIPGAFVAAAIVNIFFTAPGTDLLRSLQKSAPKLFTALIEMQQIFLKMEALVPGLKENASIIYSIPFTSAKANASSCANEIYNNIKTTKNVSFTGAAATAEDNAVSFLQSLYYKDKSGCPTGGRDSFPPGSFINWPNALTTIVSITSGAIACFSGWAQDVDNYVKGIKEYTTLPNIFQDFSPEITEKLLLISAKKLSLCKPNAEKVYPGAKTTKEFCLDSLDTLFNKLPSYNSRISPLYALNWGIWALRYMTFGACSMAISKRPHSIAEFKERVCVTASDRKFKTLIRMLGYNSAKEFIDVFSTKSGTLAFLLFLKEADFFEAINEKAGISDYQVMKSKYDKFISSMHVLTKNSSLLNSYQVIVLKETYGSDLIDNLVGDYSKITDIEKSVQTKINAMLNRIAGIASLGFIYTAQCANLYYYTFSPWQIAKMAIDKLQGKSVDLSDAVFEKIREASKKTIDREFDPYNLSFDQRFWHYIFAERASTKFQQSFLLWGIKETINLSMYLNATAHERNMGINTVNWELLGCLVAYLLKDSTGMFARFATLLDNESLRTFFSLLDKLDSPLAEKVLSEIGRFGLYSPQSLNNTIDSMMEEVITTSTGDINEIHRIANKKYQKMERIGITTLKKVGQLQEQQIIKTVNSISNNKDENSTTVYDNPIKKRSHEQPPYYQLATINLRNSLQKEMVAHGMPISDEAQKEVDSIDQFMHSNAYSLNYNNPLELMHVLLHLKEKLSDSAVNAWCYQKIISKIRCIPPQEKTQMRLKSLNTEINQRLFIDKDNQTDLAVTKQPITANNNKANNFEIDYV